MDILNEARSMGHNVMLTGEMGNVTMSYHGLGLFPKLLLTGRWLRLVDEIRSSGDRWRRAIRQWTIAPFIPEPLFRRYKQFRRRGIPAWYYFSLIHPEFAARSGVVERASREYLSFDAPPPRDSRLGRIHDIHGFCESADWCAKVRAEFGIDLRSPAFDRRVVEFCIGIPEDQYLRKGCDRWLIRRAMKGRLPDDVLYNKKRGFQSADWYPRLTRERDLIAMKVKSLAANPDVGSIIDLQRLTTLLDKWPERQPSDFDPEACLQISVPQALGAAYFIENVTGANYGDNL
jgi:asparagine synthase (glutamine-hydrolysing)